MKRHGQARVVVEGGRGVAPRAPPDQPRCLKLLNPPRSFRRSIVSLARRGARRPNRRPPRAPSTRQSVPAAAIGCAAEDHANFGYPRCLRYLHCPLLPIRLPIERIADTIGGAVGGHSGDRHSGDGASARAPAATKKASFASFPAARMRDPFATQVEAAPLGVGGGRGGPSRARRRSRRRRRRRPPSPRRGEGEGGGGVLFRRDEGGGDGGGVVERHPTQRRRTRGRACASAEPRSTNAVSHSEPLGEALDSPNALKEPSPVAVSGCRW